LVSEGPGGFDQRDDFNATLTVRQIDSEERTKRVDSISTFQADETFQDAVNDVSNLGRNV